jgi:DNA invertase Pin-like site-specific DNA recombinase
MSTGKLVFHIFGALAEFERDLIRERTQAGLAAGRVRGDRAADREPRRSIRRKKVALAQALISAVLITFHAPSSFAISNTSTLAMSRHLVRARLSASDLV